MARIAALRSMTREHPDGRDTPSVTFAKGWAIAKKPVRVDPLHHPTPPTP